MYEKNPIVPVLPYLAIRKYLHPLVGFNEFSTVCSAGKAEETLGIQTQKRQAATCKFGSTMSGHQSPCGLLLALIVPALYTNRAMIQMFDNKWLSIDEASKLTGYTGGYLRRMLRNGELKGQQVHLRMWVIDVDEAKKLAGKPHTNGRPRAKEPQIIEKKAKSKKS